MQELVDHVHWSRPMPDGAVDVVVDVSGGAPTILHWGAPVDPASALSTIDALRRPTTVGGSLAVVAPASLVPEHGSGYLGRPGLSGHRQDGSAWAPRFTAESTERGDNRLVMHSDDAVAGLALTTTVELHPSGVLRARAGLTNTAADDYWLDDLTITLALPAYATEAITFHGRWCREFQPHRQTIPVGAIEMANRSGRTSHEHPPLVWAGSAGFGEQHGHVWGAHLAWSGNSRVHIERLADGRRTITLGELLHPGEIRLAPGDSYTTPWVIGTFAASGLAAASRGFHRYARSLAGHPSGPRPVLVNTWEAVYFDHDRNRLFRLAERAASVGIERFVLDDGWFGSRRDDRSGLGDWTTSPAAHPDGLAPLIAHVRGLGMDFGIWVEPEMVNPDSELYRAHPEWVLAAPGYEPVLGRNQLVVDLTDPQCFDTIHGAIDALLTDHDIAFVKWDMNRRHVHAAGPSGQAATHLQTATLYRMLDLLRAAHPGVEIESCASGGGRIDLGILERCGRVWTSDCNDAIERQTIQRWASTLIPPEVMGAHIGPPASHTTGRRQSLELRAATAFFGHLGVEWNLLDLDDRDLDRLRTAIAAHRMHRSLLHTGDVLRIDRRGEDGTLAHGVLAADRSSAIVALVRLATGPGLLPDPLRVPELDPQRTYALSEVLLGGRPRLGVGALSRLTGAQWAAHGLQLPAMHPETAILLRLEAVS